MAADDLRKARLSNEAAKKHLAKVKELEAAPDADDWEIDTLVERVSMLEKRPPMDSASLEIDVAAKRSILRAPPWVVAVALVALVVFAWLVWG